MKLRDILHILTLGPLQGFRTQITIVLVGVVGILVQLGVLSVAESAGIVATLKILIAYFFSEKVNKAISK